MVRFGSLRRLQPIGAAWGSDRGEAIDTYYIEHFLARFSDLIVDADLSGDIHGHVLEIGDDRYAQKFGGWQTPSSRISELDILTANQAHSGSRLVADLSDAPEIASDTFDCIICTQTLQFIYDVRSAVMQLHRVLKPGGVALATVPGISQIDRPFHDQDGDFWRFTTASLRRLLEEAFPPENVRVEAYGNVLSSIAFLEGLAAEDLKPHELDARDPNYELLIAARARK